jgi:hypothetical protein
MRLYGVLRKNPARKKPGLAILAKHAAPYVVKILVGQKFIEAIDFEPT